MKRFSSRQALAIACACLGCSLGGPGLADPPGPVTENYAGRAVLVHVPSNLPARGARALVVVLHGGLGNAWRIESGASESPLKMDEVAEKDGFVVAYLNGTPVTKMFGADKLGWNAGGGCCGVPAERKVDDVVYVRGAVDYLVGKYGIDAGRVYGIGHSNGAMMTLRLMCETSLYAAAISVSGPLNLKVRDCPAARGKPVLSIHGAEDRNAPIAGGQGSKGFSKAAYNSESYTQQVFIASGADFHLQVVPGADHKLENIDAGIERGEGQSLAQKAARFFGLAR